MVQGALLRFLDLLKQELGADDARAEVGGRDPDAPGLLWTKLDSGWRLVVCFDEAPADRSARQAKLDQLVAGFSQTLTQVELPAPPEPPRHAASNRLDAALAALCKRTGAVGAAIVDVQSPALWASADPRHHAWDADALASVGSAIDRARAEGLALDDLVGPAARDVEGRLGELGLPPEPSRMLDTVLRAGDPDAIRHYLLTCLAVARVRAEAGPRPEPRWAYHDALFGYFVRRLASIYLLVLAFEGPFSELHVEARVLHAVPGIEQLLLSLPPLDPPPKGARLYRFKGKS